jgi:TRAP-type C4-dicarboxylate transport system permease small subunit
VFDNSDCRVAAMLGLMYFVKWRQKTLTHVRQRHPALALPVFVAGLSLIMAMTFIYLRPLDQFIYFQF